MRNGVIEMRPIGRSRQRAGALALTATLILSACSGADESADTTAMGDGMAMDDGMNMGDPNATPASEVEGGELVSGAFALLDTRPSGYDDVAGTAEMARHDDGTTVTIEVSGLQPGMEYISHVHAEPCSNNGGPHYQFEVGGAEIPPNEIHLLFTADEDGNGFMTAENEQSVDERAVAVVVHPVDLVDNKIACADF
jgi:Cu/Zn superoxide dismutase